MSHRIHLCLVSADDPSRVQVCACAGHWVWPIVPAATRSRLPIVGAQYLASAAIPRPAPCCVTYPSAGEAASLDWLGVYAVDRASVLPGCAWIDWSALDARASVVPYQAEAMTWYRAGLCGQRATGTFESIDAIAAVWQWVRERCEALDHPRLTLPGTWEPFRLTAHEAVIRFDATPAPVYFKATHVRPFRDACVSQAIERIAPGWGPRTLGWDERRGWWLIDHVPGLSFGARWNEATASRAIEAVRTLQQTLRPHAKTLVAAGATAIDEAFVEATHRELEVVAAGHESWPSRELEDGFTALLALMREGSTSATWNHGDLADQNVAVTNDGIRFIDQEAAAIGPSVLSVTKLARMCEAATKTTGWFDRCLHALADAWSSPRAANVAALGTFGTLALKGAAIATFGLRAASLRHRQSFGEFSPNLDAFIVRAAHQTAAAVRDADGSGHTAGR